ncbi:A1 cistron-splicing factor AAR2 [Nakaseomyces bracarensis]|uniref:A1 cistron-splicing factor AAR2 n=1 Tax=Nakaseomyces bracarensis TaxID=273131 RepID=A0ABR4NNF9_9SACH
MYHVLFNAIECEVDIGINHFSFHVKAGQPFGGIHSINSGSKDVDIIHFQHGEGVRYGYWLNPGQLYYCTYNTETEQYELFEDTDEERYDARFHELQKRGLLVQYPRIDENNIWDELTNYVKWDTISRIYDVPKGTHFAHMDSSMSTVEESERLRTHIDGTTENENPLNYTLVNFKSNEALRPEHRMHDFYDKSYYLYEVVLQRASMLGSLNNYLSELQVSFLNCIMFANYGSSMQWHNLVELLLSSDRFDRFEELDELLTTEFQNFPQDYVDMLVNTECWTRMMSTHQSHLPKLSTLFKTHPTFKQLFPKDVVENRARQESEGDSDSDVDPYQSDTTIEMNATSEDEDEPTLASGIFHQ